MATSTITCVTCPWCGGGRVALVAFPEVGPTDVRVCLACGGTWSADAPVPVDRGARAPADPRRSGSAERDL